MRLEKATREARGLSKRMPNTRVFLCSDMSKEYFVLTESEIEKEFESLEIIKEFWRGEEVE